MRDNYLKIKVHIYKDAEWFKELRKKLSNMGKKVKWQRKDTFHQTLVFIHDDACVKKLKADFSEMVEKHKPFTLTINKLDAFTAGKEHKEHIIYLTSTLPSTEMKTIADDARALVKKVKHDEREFKLHITLGRIPANAISLSEMQTLISTIDFPTFNCQLNHIEYRYKNKTGIKKKLLIGKWDL